MIKQTCFLGLLSLVIVFLAGCGGEVPDEGEAAPAAGEEAAPVVPDEEAIPLTPEAAFQQCMAKCTPESIREYYGLLEISGEDFLPEMGNLVNFCKRGCYILKANYTGNPTDCNPILSLPDIHHGVVSRDFMICTSSVVAVSRNLFACERLSSMDEICAVGIVYGGEALSDSERELRKEECERYKIMKQELCYAIAAGILGDAAVCERIEKNHPGSGAWSKIWKDCISLVAESLQNPTLCESLKDLEGEDDEFVGNFEYNGCTRKATPR